ncbi:maleylpyruvate isomerase family mycothiol-dependent enzyme [Nocardia implantans]|uniref:Maleylpyruvate isomerase family mycothiol-dependent enzyme n=1 Tax=Nocardia implantans TaxID=3108168 RepID=A0ABU6AZF0_9NOCA|nr:MULTISPECIES: maleylpyruvate isomerase family mycothiol-dependent enzyme [unclassified Nocardia]MBF6194385.1 maleylpyruvate isomerase family mycothiol-dependent enzyme [Nocardia beijingensis]MEA3529993.1 maleylpyruvate isomerase family mycothiol-dependent enzyme [Nocardia sp. CDC192]MEB3512529.1 maleylpyruvate isomerase family mycothiol-dependent enzyme [Nocardia sp. CDC186]
MTDTLVRRAVTAERTELAELLAGLDAEGWDAPTLCAGWRVREVVAHITMPYRLSSGRFTLGMIAAFGNFNRMADRTARMDAATLSTSDLLKTLWDNVDHPWRPPGGGLSNALSHDVIHGLDITVALGLDRVVPEERMRLVLDTIDPRTVKLFGAELGGIELRADDLDFSYGSGTVLSGRAQDLLLVLCGRKLPAGHLSGEPAQRFTRRE